MSARENILVYDVAADQGGALEVLNQFYEAVRRDGDKSVRWHFVLGTARLQEEENIKVYRYPWVKKSWGHRYAFDHTQGPELVRKLGCGRVISLQNLCIPGLSIPQTIYLHQVLPFSAYRFSLRNPQERKYWVYQNLIGREIVRSVRQAGRVVVQSQWLKEVCADACRVGTWKFEVIPPTVEVDKQYVFEEKPEFFRTFFYPASPELYKNHHRIIEACRILKEEGMTNYQVIFTLDPLEGQGKALYEQCRRLGLPVHFVGHLDREDVLRFYGRSVLIFPSLIESLGLPLLEAKACGAPILAADMSFSRENLGDYPNARFFVPRDRETLAKLMKTMIQFGFPYEKTDISEERADSWDRLVTIAKGGEVRDGD